MECSRSEKLAWRAQEEPRPGRIPLRRLSDLLLEYDLLEIQQHILMRDFAPHLSRNVALRLSKLRRKLDALDRRLRLRAHDLGLDTRQPIRVLRKRLAEVSARYAGAERRGDRISEQAA
jgi:hypothetical protein